MTLSYTNTLTNATLGDADKVMENFNDITTYMDAGSGNGLDAGDLKAKWYRSQMVFTFQVGAALNNTAFDFGMIKVPSIAQYAVVEGMSVGVDTIASGSIICSLKVEGSAVGGNVTATTAETPVFDSLAATTIKAGETIKVSQTSTTFTGVTYMTVCVFLKQIIKEA